MKKKIAGIDIRYDSISAVLMKKGIKGYTVESFCNVPVTNHDNIEEGIQSGIQSIMEEIDINNAVCVAAFPDDRISYRNIHVPFKDHQKIRQILPYELEPSLVFTTNDITIDFKAIKPLIHSDRTHLLAAIVENARLKSYLDVLEHEHIDPKIVSPGCYSLVSYLTSLSSGTGNELYIDIDSRKCTLFAVLEKTICTVQSFFLHQDVSFTVEYMCRNIKQTVSAFTDSLSSDFKPDKLFITGCRTNMPQIDKDIEGFMKIPVEKIDLKQNTDTAADYHASKAWDPLIMNNALALALIEIEGGETLNFRTGLFASKEQWSVHKKRFIKTGIIAGIVMALAMLNILTETFYLNKQITGIDHEIKNMFSSTFPDVKRIVDPLHQFTVELNEAKKDSFFSATASSHVKVIDVLSKISSRIPSTTDVVFSRLVKLTDSITISGNTDTFNSVDNMKSLLEDIVFFKKVTIGSANIDKADNRVRFKLKIQL